MRYIFYSAAVFLADSIIKLKAERCLCDGKERFLFKNKLRLKLYHNKGAMLNTGEEHPGKVTAISLSLCILLTLLFIASLISGRSARFKTALSLLLGGAWSNACDRLTRGYVVDYVSLLFAGGCIARIFGEKAGCSFSSIIFNISDFFIIGGCLFAAVFSDD